MDTSDHTQNKELQTYSASRAIQANRMARMEDFKAIIQNIPFKMRSLLVYTGSRYMNILHQQIAYIYSQDAQSVLVTKEGKRIPLESSLDALMARLDSTHFSRMSKFLIASLEALKGMHKTKGADIYLDLVPDLGLQFTYDQRYGQTAQEPFVDLRSGKR